jgi:hypothetical protein
MERFNLKKVNDAEVKEKYQIKQVCNFGKFDDNKQSNTKQMK